MGELFDRFLENNPDITENLTEEELVDLITEQDCNIKAVKASLKNKGIDIEL